MDCALTAKENPSKETSMTSHRLKWSPLPPNEVGRIAQYVRKGEERKEGKDEDCHCILVHSFGHLRITYSTQNPGFVMWVQKRLKLLNLREKFSFGPGFETGSSALLAHSAAPRRITERS